jgi:Ca2+-binding EF-hand superfamily protein
MKSSSLAPALFAATLFLAPFLHAADSADDAEMNAAVENQTMPKATQAEILKRFDKNGDGKLDEDEKAAAKDYNREHEEGRRGKGRDRLNKRAIQRFDKNSDGKLDDAECAEMIKAIETDPRMIKRFDKNGDGKLDESEKAAAKEAFQKMQEKRAGKN